VAPSVPASTIVDVPPLPVMISSAPAVTASTSVPVGTASVAGPACFAWRGTAVPSPMSAGCAVTRDRGTGSA
jgi:hypothetical protein